MEKYVKFIKGAFWGMLVMTVVLFYSCSKTTSITPNYTELLPQSVGNFWEYAIHDSIGNFYDTALVTIVGTTALPSGQSANIWRYHYHYKGYSDTTYVVTQGTTAIVYINDAPHNATPNYVEYQRFTVPVSVGQTTTANEDTLTVTSTRGVNVPAGNFDPAYQINHVTYSPGYKVDETIVYYNEVGIITLRHWESTSGNTFLENGNWYLLKYNVNQK